MKRLLALLVGLVAIPSAFAANPSYDSFNVNQFQYLIPRIWLKDGVTLTNVHIFGAGSSVNGQPLVGGIIGGGNMTNFGPAVVGMIPMATDVNGNYWTPTNQIPLLIVGTLTLEGLTNGVATFVNNGDNTGYLTNGPAGGDTIWTNNAGAVSTLDSVTLVSLSKPLLFNETSPADCEVLGGTFAVPSSGSYLAPIQIVATSTNGPGEYFAGVMKLTLADTDTANPGGVVDSQGLTVYSDLFVGADSWHAMDAGDGSFGVFSLMRWSSLTNSTEGVAEGVSVYGGINGHYSRNYGVMGNATLALENQDAISLAASTAYKPPGGSTNVHAVGLYADVQTTGYAAQRVMENAVAIFDNYNSGFPLLVGRTNNGDRVFLLDRDGSVTSAGTVSANAAVITNNLASINSAGAADYIDVSKNAPATITNMVAAAVSYLHATNGVAGEGTTVMVLMPNGSGSDQTLTINANWKTNVFSPVPPACTNGTITIMHLRYMALEDTSTAARQTNLCVSFEYFK